MADTTTASWWPASASRFTRFATWRIRSMPAIEVPPNFITMRAIGGALAGAVRVASGEPVRDRIGGDQPLDVDPLADDGPTVAVDQNLRRQRPRIVGAGHG